MHARARASARSVDIDPSKADLLFVVIIIIHTHLHDALALLSTPHLELDRRGVEHSGGVRGCDGRCARLFVLKSDFERPAVRGNCVAHLRAAPMVRASLPREPRCNVTWGGGHDPHTHLR